MMYLVLGFLFLVASSSIARRGRLFDAVGAILLALALLAVHGSCGSFDRPSRG